MADENVKHLFSMDQERFVRFLDRLQSIAPSASDLISTINIRIDQSGLATQHLSTGSALVVAAMISLALTFVFHGQPVVQALFTVLFAASAAAGARRLLHGFGIRSRERELRELALSTRRALEGDDGFLWRFEPFLQDWDRNLPGVVRDTLPVVCQASKQGALGDGLEDLRVYWYWAAACERRMNVDKAEMRW